MRLNITFLPLADGRMVEEAARLAEQKGTDFDDAINALVMKKKGISEVYALDPHYDRFGWIKRVVPRKACGGDGSFCSFSR